MTEELLLFTPCLPNAQEQTAESHRADIMQWKSLQGDSSPTITTNIFHLDVHSDTRGVACSPGTSLPALLPGLVVGDLAGQLVHL